VTFKKAVEGTPDLMGTWCAGLQALSRADKAHVTAEDTRRLTGSVNVDLTLKAKLPKEPRWDYAIGHLPTNLTHEMVYWVEIHPANDRGVAEVLKKLTWLKQWLRDFAPLLRAMPRAFVWVSSGMTSFTPSSPQQKQFALLGLQHKGRVLRIASQTTG
jgi:hypothetical protein